MSWGTTCPGGLLPGSSQDIHSVWQRSHKFPIQTQEARIWLHERHSAFRERINMIFHETKISGAFEIDPERKSDVRGFFARTWCQKEFKDYGLDAHLVQCSISFNRSKGTLRGLHYQTAPFAEAKLVRCTQGAIYDIVLDLRPDSGTFRDWIAVTLTAENRNMVYIPRGCAHGFLTLQDATEVLYQMSEFFNSESARGVRWNDPAFRIVWPEAVRVISERDRNYPDFE
jgi:dTDP-4-dehydrorhamnose 3,5-epimerase